MHVFRQNSLYGSSLQKLLQGRIVIPPLVHGDMSDLDADRATALCSFTFDSYNEYLKFKGYLMSLHSVGGGVSIQLDNVVNPDDVAIVIFDDVYHVYYTEPMVFKYRDKEFYELSHEDKIVRSFMYFLWPYSNYAQHVEEYDLNGVYLDDVVYTQIYAYRQEEKEDRASKLEDYWKNKVGPMNTEKSFIEFRKLFSDASEDFFESLDAIESSVHDVESHNVIFGYYQKHVKTPKEAGKYSMPIDVAKSLLPKLENEDNVAFLKWYIKEYRYARYVYGLPMADRNQYLVPYSIDQTQAESFFEETEDFIYSHQSWVNEFSLYEQLVITSLFIEFRLKYLL